MKSIVYILLFLLSLSAFSQIDSNKKTFSIPAVETVAPVEIKPVVPEKKPIEKPTIAVPKKEFSMFPEEEFGDPGELYIDDLNKSLDHLKLSEKELEMKNGSAVDVFLGDYTTPANFVNIVYRDFGAVDGDLIQVRVNDDVIQARVFLTNGFNGFKLDLIPGKNKIDFLALNQGQSGPNTAEYRIVDDSDILISNKQWSLATGVKATIVINKI